MKAFLYHKNQKGSPFHLEEIPTPEPTEYQVLIKVLACSPNAGDYRSIQLGAIPKSRVFGSGVAGVITACGEKIKDYNAGDPIIADLSDVGFGGLAEFSVAPLHVITPKPPTLSFTEAAALPVAATTAHKAMFKAGIRKGHSVLIIGGSGGVGTFAVQIAKYLGANVTAICSTANVEQAINMGADKVIDYKKEDFTKSKETYDAIIAINGTYSIMASRKRLKKEGIYIQVGGQLTQIFNALIFGPLLSLGSKKIKFLSAKSDAQSLQVVTELAVKGKIKPLIEKVFPFDQTPVAMDYISKGHAKGKLVIENYDE